LWLPAGKSQDLWDFLQDWDKPKSKDAYPDEEECNGQPDTCCEKGEQEISFDEEEVPEHYK